ncbi:uncharacterized protein LOC136034215 [Artemia franciscana]|uniref:uncharacterized protein LOC136034215 n=1 Tax=Artemia franciscana TaxID=6661 RepID=UPI0032D9BD35
MFIFLLIGLTANSATSGQESAPALSNNLCYWSGSPPFCTGTCNDGESPVRASASGDNSMCITGQKVYCCRSELGIAPADNLKPGCIWKGTAPFCAGTCDVNFRLEKFSDVGDGHPCWTGRKALCCPLA